MNIKKAALCALLGVLIAISCVTPASGDGSTHDWQGHKMRAISITTDENEIRKVFTDPTPAQGYLALVRLTTTDGSRITEDKARQFNNEFLLADNEGINSERPMRHYLDGENLALIFYMRNWHQNPALSLTVNPPAGTTSGKLLDTRLTWKGQRLKVASTTNDRAALANLTKLEWPEKGYLLAIKLENEDGSALPNDILGHHAHEFAITDGMNNEYRPKEAFIHKWISDEDWAEATPVALKPYTTVAISMIYEIDADPVPAVESFALSVKPRGVLWADASFRDANTLPLNSFVPKAPNANTAAIFLEIDSLYAYNSGIAVENIDRAFTVLDAALNDIRDGLQAAFGRSTLTISNNPDLASIAVGVKIRYPLAGDYYIEGYSTPSLKAYNCVLTLTAYDAVTKKAVSTLTIGAHYGSSVTAVRGANTIWKDIPKISDADETRMGTFIYELLNFWSAWTPPPAPPTPLNVQPTQSTVFVNGAATAFEAYNIGGNNYFKLRDLAYALNGTNKQFAIGYEVSTRAITLSGSRPYVPEGNEMARGDGSAKTAVPNKDILISKDGAPVEITAYLIGGNNFVRLRDVMKLFNVGVTYDQATRNIGIDTSIAYTD